MRRNYFFDKLPGACLLLFLIACSKNSDNINPVYYFKGTINNVQTELLITDPDDPGDIRSVPFITSSRFPDVSPNPNYFFVEMALGSSFIDDRQSTGSSVLSIYVVRKLPESFSSTQMNSVTQIGNYPFGKHNQNSGTTVEGGIVWYIDKNGANWYSEMGDNPAPGNTFEVAEKVNSPYYNNQAIWKVKVNCNLYNNNGNSIRINGECRAQALISN